MASNADKTIQSNLNSFFTITQTHTLLKDGVSSTIIETNSFSLTDNLLNDL